MEYIKCFRVLLLFVNVFIYGDGVGISMTQYSKRVINLKSWGKMRGVKVDFPNNFDNLKAIERYAGIKFGSLKGAGGKSFTFFQPTSIMPTWSDIRDFTDYAPVCKQDAVGYGAKLADGSARKFMKVMENLKKQQEDCLYLNLWSPIPVKNISSDDKGYIPRVIRKHLGSTIVTTKYGRIRGSLVEFPKESFIDLEPIEAYFGLQYAYLRQGRLRFARPTSPVETWKGYVHSATDPKAICPQQTVSPDMLPAYIPNATITMLRRLSYFTDKQSEECLSLNLFVPPRDEYHVHNFPVMIFVHGESYEVGTGNAYDGSVLASYGEVIVITVNYRLGVLGFLRTGDKSADGNYALWDLLAILYWVKENIKAFSGDPSRVTLFGHGHGAALVNLLLFTDIANQMDLFNNVILQSGSAFSSWATSIDPSRCAHIVAKKVNCTNSQNNTAAMIKCLREDRSVDELIKSVPLTPKYFTCFAPSVEGTMFPKGKTLEQLVKSKDTKFASTKIMFGLARKEAYAYLKQHELEYGMSKSRKEQIIRTYVSNVFKYHRQQIYDMLELQYTQWDMPRNNVSRRDEIMDMLSDGLYKAPLIKMAKEHSKHAETYLYSFGYSTQSEDYPQWSGGVHGDELPYIFGAPLVSGLSPFPSNYDSHEKELSKFMMRMWTNFAKTGDPNLPEWNEERETPNLTRIERWPTYNESTQSYIHIGKKGPKEKDFYRAKELALWLNYLPKIDKACPDEQHSTHDLVDASNLSTFDEPSRLISKFQQLFPMPPPPPIPTPTVTEYIKDPQYETSTSFEDGVPNKTTPKPIAPTNKPGGEESVGKVQTTSPPMDASSVPLSITVAVGCSLLFLNLLIFAGVYYQRERIRKLRAGNSRTSNGGDILDNRATENNKKHENTPETVNLMQTSDLQHHSKVASMNHKDSAPVYSTISKPLPPQGPGGYNYSALSQKSSSPMHTNNQINYQGTNPSYGNKSEEMSHSSTKPGGTNTRAPERSPMVDPRLKQTARGNHNVTSNNAITIV